MASIREQIIASRKVLLAGVPGIGGRCYRSRTDKISTSQMPCIGVSPDIAPASDSTTGGVDEALELLVSVYVAGDEPDALADPIVCAAYAAMMGDPECGGLAIDTAPASTSWVLSEDTAEPQVRVEMRFTITHRHQRETLEQ